MKKELIKLTRFIVPLIIVGIIIGSLGIYACVMYYHKVLLINYIIADDYSYVVNAKNKEQSFSPIEKLPDAIDEKFGGLLWEGRLEHNKSKLANFYLYEYNGLDYLRVEIYDNKLIVLGEDTSIEIFYYVEDT